MVMKLAVAYLAIAIILTAPFTNAAVDSSPQSVERWFGNLPNLNQKLTRLHFYFQDVVSGRHPTAVEVARSPLTSSSSTFFGLVRVYDDPLTVRGDPSSRTVGYGQGIYAGASQSDVSLLFTLNFYFTDGIYDGSTLSLQGRNPLAARYREMSITGGTGVFRLAKGIAVASTYWANATTQDGIVEFTVYVQHYESVGGQSVSDM